MIDIVWIAGEMCLVLHRCNEYSDHAELGRDGDILFNLCGNGVLDIADAQCLVTRLQSRLTPAQPDAKTAQVSSGS
jgi:hypothetical protein